MINIADSIEGRKHAYYVSEAIMLMTHTRKGLEMQYTYRGGLGLCEF